MAQWIDENHFCDDAERAAVVAIIDADPSRPAYGERWGEFLGSLPDVLLDLIPDSDTAAIIAGRAVAQHAASECWECGCGKFEHRDGQYVCSHCGTAA